VNEKREMRTNTNQSASGALAEKDGNVVEEGWDLIDDLLYMAMRSSERKQLSVLHLPSRINSDFKPRLEFGNA
jgi:hypothetical protein